MHQSAMSQRSGAPFKTECKRQAGSTPVVDNLSESRDGGRQVALKAIAPLGLPVRLWLLSFFCFASAQQRRAVLSTNTRAPRENGTLGVKASANSKGSRFIIDTALSPQPAFCSWKAMSEQPICRRKFGDPTAPSNRAAAAAVLAPFASVSSSSPLVPWRFSGPFLPARARLSPCAERGGR